MTQPSEDRWPLKRAEMEQHRDQLIKRTRIKASIQKKSSSCPYYVLRWREKQGSSTVKRSLYLGSEEMAEMARNLLNEWKREPKERSNADSARALDELYAAIGRAAIDFRKSRSFRRQMPLPYSNN